MWSLLAESLLDPSGVVEGVRDWRRERRDRQRARAAAIACALRVVDGAHPGLGRRWTGGAARVPPGTVVFQPDSQWRARMTIPVRSAALQETGDVPRVRCWTRGRPSRRIMLTTARGTLEWLVPEEQVQRAMGVIRGTVRARNC